MSPRFEYDVELNAFFRSAAMVGDAWNTQAGYARDLMAFLNFLWGSRGGKSWRDATEADHVAYLTWRRKDERGPRIADSTWDREVAAVNRFYRWQIRAGHLRENPLPQRERRAIPVDAGRGRSGETASDETPATYSHGAGREKIEWLPAASYRRWRDVGMRGYTVDGLPNPRFRGRWASRNATFCDLMVRTGLRLAEQTALTLFEVPLDRGAGGYQRFWLPPAIAKGGSARWVYAPASIVAELVTYAEIDRAEVVEDARAADRFRRIRRPFVVEDPTRPVARSADGHQMKVARLDPDERRRLLVDGPDGLEPAAFWLSEYGMPVTTSTWKDLFRQANLRCRAQGVNLHAFAHLLRQRPLPGYRGKVNINFLAATLGYAHTTLDRCRYEIDAAAAAVGVSTYSYFNIPITGRLGDQPWLDGISNDPRADNWACRLGSNAAGRAYSVLAFLSGMRDST
jgi:hypothetical protein